jgi:hypothetical protein
LDNHVVHLKERENIHIDSMFGHGGIFKTEKVAQSFLAAALDIFNVLKAL